MLHIWQGSPDLTSQLPSLFYTEAVSAKYIVLGSFQLSVIKIIVTWMLRLSSLLLRENPRLELRHMCREWWGELIPLLLILGPSL